MLKTFERSHSFDPRPSSQREIQATQHNFANYWVFCLTQKTSQVGQKISTSNSAISHCPDKSSWHRTKSHFKVFKGKARKKKNKKYRSLTPIILFPSPLLIFIFHLDFLVSTWFRVFIIIFPFFYLHFLVSYMTWNFLFFTVSSFFLYISYFSQLLSTLVLSWASGSISPWKFLDKMERICHSISEYALSVL